jgi:glucose-6-phosphate isomerase
MTAKDLWERYQHELMVGEGWMLDSSRIPFPDDFRTAMAPAISKALEAMTALESGAIANPDEKRAVGHYWLRDPERAPKPEWALAIRDSVNNIKDFAAKVHSGELHPPTTDRFTHAVVVGIGGSALGPQLASAALAKVSAPVRLHFVDNTDPDGIDVLLDQLSDALSSTLIVVMSKSGGTKETRNGMLEMAAAYERAGLVFAKHAVAVTGEGSLLDQIAVKDGWLQRFPMWDWVGGRTSEMSAVGLVPAALQGVDIDALLSGAKSMDQATRSHDWRNNPALSLALAWHFETGGKGQKDMVILPYKDRLALTSRYLQQLVMESLGKERDLDGKVVHQGIAVYGNKGSTDQHAYVQQLRDGVPNFFVTFIEVLKDRSGTALEVEPGITSGDYLLGFLLGTRQALYENKRHSLTITLDEVSPRSLGALIALFERAVGFYATMVNINAYHQPGVEAGKKAAANVLTLQEKIVAVLSTTATPAAELAKAAGLADQAETAYKILEHMVANQRGVTREGERHPSKAKYRKS